VEGFSGVGAMASSAFAWLRIDGGLDKIFLGKGVDSPLH
jgi:hypothetical protein